MNLKTILNKKTAHNTRLTSLLLGGGKKAGAVLRKHICVKNPPPTQNPKTLPAKLKKTDQYAKI
jgi:hypothetical protein